MHLLYNTAEGARSSSLGKTLDEVPNEFNYAESSACDAKDQPSHESPQTISAGQ